MMTESATPRIILDDEPLAPDGVVRIARGSRLELGPTARRRIAASRAVVDRLVDGPDLVYGLNTGLGHMRNERLPREELEASQVLVVQTHAGGLGAPLPVEVVRAAMAVRVAGIARGGSGASPAVAETYVAMLNAGVHPIVPAIGSVGASDLMHMAAIALVAIGEGEAEFEGARLPGAEALARAGIPPLRLGPKDGLTVISSNGVAIGHAALVLDRAAAIADAADLVVAVSLEAVRGNPSIVELAVALAKGVPGQIVASARIRSFLENSRLCTLNGPASVQDPLSFRVAPQIHGAYRELLTFAGSALATELAAMDDNPLVSIADGRMISNGNFHPAVLALAMDALRPAIAHVGQLSDRRTGQIWDRLFADPEAFTPEGIARAMRSGTPLLRYAGAARAAELRSLAGPATLDVAPLDLGVEDHATNAPFTVRRTEEALRVLEDVLAVELLTAIAHIDWQDTRPLLAPRTSRVVGLLASTLGALGGGSSSSAIHNAAREILLGPLLEVAGEVGERPKPSGT